jgi:hypothetical protein
MEMDIVKELIFFFFCADFFLVVDLSEFNLMMNSNASKARF